MISKMTQEFLSKIKANKVCLFILFKFKKILNQYLLNGLYNKILIIFKQKKII